MMEFRNVRTGVDYRAQSPETLTRRLYGKTAAVYGMRKDGAAHRFMAVDRLGNVLGDFITYDALE